MAARLKTIVAIAMLALYDEYDEFDTYWQNGGYKKISDIIFAECRIFIVSNLCPSPYYIAHRSIKRLALHRPPPYIYIYSVNALVETSGVAKSGAKGLPL
jgi:hypothetical protein